ncbi:MAG: amidinotransferase [Candidatus Omnitrophica bacterium]|nr:amidinotransferase [Candidatus Omnitrophota bacterium]
MSVLHSPFPVPHSLLMCRPTRYTIAYEINPWMSLKRQVNPARAQLQWNRLYHLLSRRLGVPVKLLPPHAGVPDLVFTANAGLVVDRTLIRSNFRYPERQREEPIIERYFRKAGFRIVRLDRRYDFEGEGDALWMADTLIFGFRFRSDAPVHEALARLLGARVLPVELRDRRFYHLDTCFCPLDARSALWFPGAFDRYGQRVIESLVRDPVAVSEADAAQFVCNAILVSPQPAGTGRAGASALIVQEGLSASLKRRLIRRGFRLYPLDLSEFLKAGGSAKCLVLRIGKVPGSERLSQ